MAHLPIACTLDAAALRAGAADLLPGLVAAAIHVAPLPDGLRLTLPAVGDTLRHVAAVLDRERRCCAFLRFALEVPPGGAPFVLDVTGPPGTGAYLATLAAALMPRTSDAP
jgi:hypothetical protein